MGSISVSQVKQVFKLNKLIHSLRLGLKKFLVCRFIESYGTHVITSVTIGGKDVIYVKQHSSSHLSSMDIKNYIQVIGDQRFSENEGHSNSSTMKMKDKASALFLM